MNTDQDIAELKECQRHLEAKIAALIECHPALRRAHCRADVRETVDHGRDCLYLWHRSGILAASHV
jgi:hypothetical protein